MKLKRKRGLVVLMTIATLRIRITPAATPKRETGRLLHPCSVDAAVQLAFEASTAASFQASGV